jgi:glucose dehydrogenase
VKSDFPCSIGIFFDTKNCTTIRSIMGIASLILGIISVLFALIPGCGLFLAPVPALIGMGLGIADWVRKGKAAQPKGIAVAGTIVSVLAFVVLAGWVGVMASQKPEGMTFKEWMESQNAEIQEAVEEAQKEIEAQGTATESATPEGN